MVNKTASGSGRRTKPTETRTPGPSNQTANLKLSVVDGNLALSTPSPSRAVSTSHAKPTAKAPDQRPASAGRTDVTARPSTAARQATKPPAFGKATSSSNVPSSAQADDAESTPSSPAAPPGADKGKRKSLAARTADLAIPSSISPPNPTKRNGRRSIPVIPTTPDHRRGAPKRAPSSDIDASDNRGAKRVMLKKPGSVDGDVKISGGLGGPENCDDDRKHEKPAPIILDGYSMGRAAAEWLYGNVDTALQSHFNSQRPGRKGAAQTSSLSLNPGKTLAGLLKEEDDTRQMAAKLRAALEDPILAPEVLAVQGAIDFLQTKTTALQRKADQLESELISAEAECLSIISEDLETTRALIAKTLAIELPSAAAVFARLRFPVENGIGTFLKALDRAFPNGMADRLEKFHAGGDAEVDDESDSQEAASVTGSDASNDDDGTTDLNMREPGVADSQIDAETTVSWEDMLLHDRSTESNVGSDVGLPEKIEGDTASSGQMDSQMHDVDDDHISVLALDEDDAIDAAGEPTIPEFDTTLEEAREVHKKKRGPLDSAIPDATDSRP